MIPFLDFLNQRIPQGGFATEDILVSFLPLARQVLETHRTGKVAPLRGVEQLHVDGVRIGYANEAAMTLKSGDSRLRAFQSYWDTPIDVVAQSSTNRNLDSGDQRQRSLDVLDESDPVERPVYRTHYVAWEHAIEIHDPLTDIFVLGLILASLGCGRDFTRREQLEEWVRHHRNLFELNPDLHPVIAQTIFRMTQLDRSRRSQDLSSLIYALENYRDQTVDIDFDLSSIPGFAQTDTSSRRQLILSRLRERLFDLTRRNRLLHFQQTLHTANLTQGSVPLSFDLREIRPDQIMVWNEQLSKQVASGKSIPLNKHLNFAEAIYLPPLLDRLIADSRRDLAEYGFVQLRLVACFLRWANLKESPKEIFHSPLVLIPVQLKKRKGIRDTYELVPQSELAEVNPVIRHLFHQLYAIELPETIDLSKTDLSALFEALRKQIEANEPAVQLRRIDRPQVELVHERARRKLEQYRRRARRYAKGQRTYADLQYSYDPANYEPLGVRIYQELIRPQATRLDSILRETPKPRAYAVNSEEAPAGESEVEHSKSFAQFKGDGAGNPYHWDFDLCNLTLANFKYRKMSLVRDYDALLDEMPQHEVFQAIFDSKPRLAQQQPPTPRLDERADILPCDPTQATAIARARNDESYIIQGPPGTGKSQTIANLIADYVSRGKRVLFVCEKRAAIDVVFARLKQCGIGNLACLIHDTQADKREFVHDLRDGFEQLVEERKSSTPRGKNRQAVQKILSDLEPLDRFNRLMLGCPNETGVPVREVIETRLRSASLRDNDPQGSVPPVELDVVRRERLPTFAQWYACRDPLERLQRWLIYGNRGRPLATHPFRWLAPELTQQDQPVSLVSRGVQRSLEIVAQIQPVFVQAHRDSDRWPTADSMQPMIAWAARAVPLAQANRLDLVDEHSEASKWWAQQQSGVGEAQAALEQHQKTTEHWRDKLSAGDTKIALEQARRWESAWWKWLAPGWWRLRGMLNTRYDFAAHAVRPTERQVLESLSQEHELRNSLERASQESAGQLGWGESFEASSRRIESLRQDFNQASPAQRQEIETLRQSSQTVQSLEAWQQIGVHFDQLDEALQDWHDRWRGSELDSWLDDLQRLPEQLDGLPDFLEALRILRELPPGLRQALREFDLTHEQFQEVIAETSLATVWAQNRPASGFSGEQRNVVQESLERSYKRWLEENARQLRFQVGHDLWDAIQLADKPRREVETEDREQRDLLAKGLKELHREFKKSMRYRAIRDLVADETGEVIKRMKPVWLMSPLSVSDALPLDPNHFDVVIFDEASQITLEEAVPSLFRAGQAIVVGDEKQMPPTQFFRARSSDDQWEDEDEQEALGLEESSFLSHCAQSLPSTLLGWHYRSRNESLISFSNWSFYSGRLLTAPEETLASRRLPSLKANSAADAREAIEGTLERPISFHRLENGCYEGRRNRAEAEYIAELVRGILAHPRDLTLGIIAFSEAQQDEIETALGRLARQDPEFRERLDIEMEREDDGQFNGLLVKNLENIQGDERDIVILSVCYGPDPQGRVRMNFGPINQSGGEKRLNVAFSRAKHHMVVVSSMGGEAITNDYNPGAAVFKNYLLYAQAMSEGQAGTAERILQSTHKQSDPPAADPWESGVTEPLTSWLESQGFVVDRNVGQSRFKCHLAIRRPEDSVYRLGILVDGKSYYEQDDLLERDLMRPRLLRDFGWQVIVLLAADWWQRKESLQQELLERLKDPHPEDPAAKV